MKTDQNSNPDHSNQPEISDNLNSRLANALSNVDDDLLESALMERHRLLEGRPTAKSVKNLGRLCRIAAVAACLALAVAIPAFALALRRSDRPAEPAGSGPASGIQPTVTADTTEKGTTPPPTGTTSTPGYVPAFDEPSLEEIYQTEPFARLFPKSGFDKLQLSSSYRSLPDKILGENLFLHTSFKLPSDDSENLIVCISDPGNWKSEQIYDPEKNYIGPDKLIPAKHLTKDVVDLLYCKISDPELNYRYSFRIFLLCELDGKKYEVEYEYYGNGFTPEMLYELITSADCFQNASAD